LTLRGFPLAVRDALFPWRAACGPRGSSSRPWLAAFLGAVRACPPLARSSSTPLMSRGHTVVASA
jgi:hypothetical protein